MGDQLIEGDARAVDQFLLPGGGRRVLHAARDQEDREQQEQRPYDRLHCCNSSSEMAIRLIGECANRARFQITTSANYGISAARRIIGPPVSECGVDAA